MSFRTLIPVLAVAVGSAQLSADDDRVLKNLQTAKATYQKDVEGYRKAVHEWFDKREEVARKDGDKKLVDLIKADRKTFTEKEELPKTAPASLKQKLTSANAAMESAYKAAVKVYTQAKMDTEAAAIEQELEKFRKDLLASSRLPDGTPETKPPPLISPAALAAKLAGRATYDPKTGVLTVAYTFADRRQLQDFECGDVKPALTRNGLQLNGGESVRHVVKFDTVAVTAVLGVKQMKGQVLTTSEGTTVGVGGANPDTVYFNTKGGRTQDVIVPNKVRSGPVGIELVVTEKRASFQYGADKLGREINKPGAGQVRFYGGELGFSYGALVLSGKVNPEWAAGFFGPK